MTGPLPVPRHCCRTPDGWRQGLGPCYALLAPARPMPDASGEQMASGRSACDKWQDWVGARAMGKSMRRHYTVQ